MNQKQMILLAGGVGILALALWPKKTAAAPVKPKADTVPDEKETAQAAVAEQIIAKELGTEVVATTTGTNQLGGPKVAQVVARERQNPTLKGGKISGAPGAAALSAARMVGYSDAQIQTAGVSPKGDLFWYATRANGDWVLGYKATGEPFIQQLTNDGAAAALVAGSYTVTINPKTGLPELTKV